MNPTIEALREEQRKRIRQKKSFWLRKICFLLIGCIFLLTAVVLYNVLIVNKHFEITYYTCDSDKISQPVKMALLADLHNHVYGKDNEELLDALREEQPDIILVAGDMVTYSDADVSVAVKLCREMVKIAPVYYQYGNHESVLMRYGIDGIKVPIDAYLKQEGVHFFYNNFCTIEVNGNELDLAGISVSERYYDIWAVDTIEEFQKSERFKLLISHYPSLYYETLYDANIDLAVAGHYHGGIIRIPGIGGLYHPSDGIFPKYAGGKYQLGQGTLIVTRGLGSHEKIPRINNKPELVIITLQ